MNKIFNGDCLEEMKKLPDNSVDSIVTDPPYGLEFMGKKWDYDVPSVDIFKEMLRIAKPGSHILCFGGSRTYHRIAVNIEDAGWEIRDTMQWIYGSGFPKSMNISKAIDKKEGVEFTKEQASGVGFMNNDEDGYNNTIHQLKQVGESTENSKKWDGWGTALKPAYEPIILARKPLDEKTIADNVLKHGTGGINIDESRIKTNDKLNGGMASKGRPQVVGTGWDRPWMHDKEKTELKKEESKINVEKAEKLGRFPANIILSHHPECIKDGVKNVKSSRHIPKTGRTKGNIYGEYKGVECGIDYNFKRELIENWNCHQDCPIHIMDKQSGVLKSGDILPHHQTNESENNCMSGKNYKRKPKTQLGDIGGASRFFYCAKASKSDRGKDNNHPTVKPIKLMEYLVKLITPKDGICIDPFSGSGSTLVACKKLGYKYIGIEREQEYIEIIKKRLKEVKGNALKRFEKEV